MNNQSVWDHHYQRERSRQLYPDENVVRALKKNFTLQTSGAALDLGCGSGRHLPLLTEHFSRVYACDFSHESLKQSRDARVACVQSALPALPFASEIFDFILCWGVLHYLNPAELAPAIAAIRAVLRPSGVVFLTLRADSDTHLQRQLSRGDLAGGHAQLYGKTEAIGLFREFSAVKYGYIARQPVGEEGLVAHHMLYATR